MKGKKKILESSFMKSNYKSLRAREKASKHYARGVRKLCKELKEMNEKSIGQSLTSACMA